MTSRKLNDVRPVTTFLSSSAVSFLTRKMAIFYFRVVIVRIISRFRSFDSCNVLFLVTDTQLNTLSGCDTITKQDA